MRESTQISAHVHESTRELLERYAEAHGIKKGHLIESALLHHLQALQEIPADLVIPPRIVLEPESAAEVLRLVAEPREPTEAMKALFASKLTE